jgi:chromosome segregation ATPase
MTEDVLARHLTAINAIKERDEDEFATRLHDQQKADLSAQISKLEATVAKLRDEQNSLGEQLDALEPVQLGPNYGVSGYREEGAFFDQLRAIEADQDRAQGELTGLKGVKRKLEAELSLYDAKVRRLFVQLESLRSDFSAAESDRLKRVGDLTQRKSVLATLDSELALLVRTCEGLRTSAQDKATELRGTSEESIGLLVATRKGYEEALLKRRARIQQLQKERRDQASVQAVDTKLRRKGSSLSQSTANWMTERASLVSKVKKVREELAMFDSRSRSATRSSTRTASRKEQAGYSEDEAKIAIVREIAEVKADHSMFLAHTHESELTVQAELTAKLTELERTQIEIEEFQKGAMNLLNQQRINAAQESKLRALRRELLDLRARIGQ